MDIVFTSASSMGELQQILDLQQANLRLTRSVEEEKDQGFVTVQHDMDLLSSMNNVAQHVIAKDGEQVVGYALAMTRDFKQKVPILAPMFDLLDNLVVDGLRIGDTDYIVMGQVCVDKEYRGKGIFQGLYKYYFETLRPQFGCVITEIAARNTRSLKAHLGVGFKVIYEYTEEGFEDWIVVRY